jgi:hypothetical protein
MSRNFIAFACRTTKETYNRISRPEQALYLVNFSSCIFLKASFSASLNRLISVAYYTSTLF